MSARYTEAEVAAAVVEYLQAQGYDVYQEVELIERGIRADIVARRGPELTIVETKTSASLVLLSQAMERRRFAHRVYIAIPVVSRDMVEVCGDLGIGVMRVRMGYPNESPEVSEQVTSRRWNTRPMKLASKLRPEHKTACQAGSPTGGHWSRWRDTCARLAALVGRKPGLDLKQALQASTHHYSSLRCAASTMAGHIREGRVAGVVLKDGALWPA